MIYPRAHKKRISWEPSLHPGTPRSDRKPCVHRQSTPRQVGTNEAPFHVTADNHGPASTLSFHCACPEYQSDTLSFQQLRLDDNMLYSHGVQAMASQKVAAGHPTPVSGSPALSHFGGSFSSSPPSTFKIGHQLATPFPTFGSNFDFDFSKGAQHSPALSMLNRSSTLFWDDPATASGSLSFGAAAPCGCTHHSSNGGFGGFGGDHARQVPAHSAFESSLNGSSSTLFHGAPCETATPSRIRFNASTGELGSQRSKQASVSSAFGSSITPKSHSFNAAAPFGLPFSVASNESGGQCKRQASAVPAFGSSPNTPSSLHFQSTPGAFKPCTPTFSFGSSDRPGVRKGQQQNLFRFGNIQESETMGAFEAPASVTRSSASPHSQPHTPGSHFRFLTGGPQVLASTSRPAYTSAGLGVDAKPQYSGFFFGPQRPSQASTQDPVPRTVLTPTTKVAPTVAYTSLPPHHQQPPAVSEPPRPADDSSEGSGLAVVGSPLKMTSSSTTGRRTCKGTKADGEFVHASLKEIRKKVGFIKPKDIQRVKNKDQLVGALKALQDGSFHCNKRHFRPEPNHFGRQLIRVSGKKAVLQQRLMWFLFHTEFDNTGE